MFIFTGNHDASVEPNPNTHPVLTLITGDGHRYWLLPCCNAFAAVYLCCSVALVLVCVRSHIALCSFL